MAAGLEAEPLQLAADAVRPVRPPAALSAGCLR